MRFNRDWLLITPGNNPKYAYLVNQQYDVTGFLRCEVLYTFYNDTLIIRSFDDPLFEEPSVKHLPENWILA